MLIVEGADCLGKTTFCKKLLTSAWLQKEGYVYKHFSRLPSGFHYYWDYIANMVHRSVHDRFHMSEIAYCYARKEESSPLTAQMYRMVDGYLRGMGAFTVVIVAETENVMREKYKLGHHGEEEMYKEDAVVRANHAFALITQHVYGIQLGKEIYEGVDVDYVITLDREKQWPSDKDVENVLLTYQQRCDQWASAISARRNSFQPSPRLFVPGH